MLMHTSGFILKSSSEYAELERLEKLTPKPNHNNDSSDLPHRFRNNPNTTKSHQSETRPVYKFRTGSTAHTRQIRGRLLGMQL